MEVLSSSVIEARQLEVDERLRAETNSFIGQVLVRQNFAVDRLEEPPEESRVTDLATAIDRAREGSKEAQELIRGNVMTDYFERAYKSGFVSEVQLQRDSSGRLRQHEQTMQDVSANTLAHMTNEKLRGRAKIEALNSVRDQYYADEGLLGSHARVVFSLIHDEMDDAEAESVGFFTHTRSVSIQLLTETDDGDLLMQTAFVAGREDPSQDSFDKEAVIGLAEQLGVDYTDLTSEDILESPLLIDKKMLPKGILSVVQRYDYVASEVSGGTKFFGRDHDSAVEITDYEYRKIENEQNQKRMSSEIDQVVSNLLMHGSLTPVQATEKLAELNDAVLKSNIVRDESIDARVLGATAAWHVEHARHLLRIGEPPHDDMMKLQRMINRGTSSSCPNGNTKSKSDELGGTESELNDESVDTKPEDCDFVSKECPKCGTKNVKTSCRNGKYYGECGCKS